MIKKMKEMMLTVKLELRKLMPSKMLIKHQFKRIFGRTLDLRNPKTFNEKLQWIKLHDHNPLYTTMVDKYAVKGLVKELIGEKYVIPTLGLWNNPDDIDISNLPEKFVLKATHDSGSYFICDDRNGFDISKVRKKLKKALRHNFYFDGREWPYKNVKPRVIAEEYIGYYPMDYKFFVFNGVIDSVMVCKGREAGHPAFYFYDVKWNRLYYQHDDIEFEDEIEEPENFQEMVQLVEKLAANFCHVRVDMYNINGKIYFGEYTLFDQGGYDTDITYETDLMWGQKMNLRG